MNHASDESSIKEWRSELSSFARQVQQQIRQVIQSLPDVTDTSAENRPTQISATSRSPASHAEIRQASVIDPQSDTKALKTRQRSPATDDLPIAALDASDSKPSLTAKPSRRPTATGRLHPSESDGKTPSLDDSQDRLANLKRQLAAKLSAQLPDENSSSSAE